MSCVNHGSVGGLVRSFQRSEGMWREEGYMKQVERKKRRTFGEGKKLSFYFLILRKCGIDLELDYNQLKAKLDLDFFFS